MCRGSLVARCTPLEWVQHTQPHFFYQTLSSSSWIGSRPTNPPLHRNKTEQRRKQRRVWKKFAAEGRKSLATDAWRLVLRRTRSQLWSILEVDIQFAIFFLKGQGYVGVILSSTLSGGLIATSQATNIINPNNIKFRITCTFTLISRTFHYTTVI